MALPDVNILVAGYGEDASDTDNNPKSETGYCHG